MITVKNCKYLYQGTCQYNRQLSGGKVIKVGQGPYCPLVVKNSDYKCPLKKNIITTDEKLRVLRKELNSIPEPRRVALGSRGADICREIHKLEIQLEREKKEKKDNMSENIKKDLQNDFRILKRKLQEINLGIPDFKINPRIKQTKLVFTNRRDDFYSNSKNTIYLSLKESNSCSKDLLRRILTHEMLHAGGLGHRHRYGFYGIISRDTFTLEIMKKIGWSVPKKEEIIKHYYSEIKRTQHSRFRISCKQCDFEAFREKRSKVINNINKYRCPKCKGPLIVKEI